MTGPVTDPLAGITTARLRLRPVHPDDHDDYAAMVGDAAVTRHLGGAPLSRQQAWDRLLRAIGHWAAFGHGLWTVRDAATGAYLGETGFMDFRRDIVPPLGPMPEAAWVFAAAAHGRGIAQEAAAAAHDWLAAHRPAGPTQCIVAPDNRGSIRLAERLGYRLHDSAVYQGAATNRYIRAPTRVA